MIFCIKLPNFIHIRPPIADVWRHIDLTSAAQYYFRFRVCWCRCDRCLQKVKIYQQTKFRLHISIHGWDITTSGLGKQTSAIFEFYFRFRFDHFTVICVSLCIRLPNFVQIGPPTAEIWRYIDFQDGSRQPCCFSFGLMMDNPQSAFRGLNSIFKYCLFVGLIVPEILRCIDFGVLAWNCLFTPLLGEFLGHISPYDVTHRRDHKRPFLGGNTSFEPFSVRFRATVRAGRVIEKKGQDDNKKVKKMLYFPYLWGKLHWTNST